MINAESLHVLGLISLENFKFFSERFKNFYYFFDLPPYSLFQKEVWSWKKFFIPLDKQIKVLIAYTSLVFWVKGSRFMTSKLIQIQKGSHYLMYIK